MIISINWLKQFTTIDLPIADLAVLIGARLVEIEGVNDISTKYDSTIIAKIISVEPHHNADKLNVCMIDDGGVAASVERNEHGHIQVVCGAPNAREGMLVAWLPPGAIVPSTYGDPEPFILESRELRGVVSNGMFASAHELDLFDDHSGIIEIDDAKIGSTLALSYELNDYLLDIENKSLTHRPDAFGVIGFAREVAAISGQPFSLPEWFVNTAQEDEVEYGEEVGVSIDDATLSSRYQAVVLEGSGAHRRSPFLVQSYLARVGVRPISVVVDVTNYLMMLTGQPLHAFDYAKTAALNDGVIDIHVRAGTGAETLELLDGRTITLQPEDIVITNGATPIALAGAMGGSATEVDENTQKIIIESASFNLYNLRATQMRHGIYSEAITRFTKGQPPEIALPVLRQAISLLGEYAGYTQASKINDVYPIRQEIVTVSLTIQNINQILGTNFAEDDVVRILESVQCVVVRSDDEVLSVTAPWWRSDLHIVEEIVEEVGRIAGFDAITPTLPLRHFTPIAPAAFDIFRSHIRQLLARFGANEVYSYSFVPESLLEKTGQNVLSAYKIVNAISPDLQRYRLSITPSLLTRVHQNSKAGYSEFALFEVGKVHSKEYKDIDGLPHEFHQVSLVYGQKNVTEPAYYQVKYLLDSMLYTLGVDVQYTMLNDDFDSPLAQPFQRNQSAVIRIGDENIGVIGQYKPSVAKKLKLPQAAAGFEFDLEKLFTAYDGAASRYRPLSKYPSTWQDICIQTDPAISYANITEQVQVILATTQYSWDIEPIDIYAPISGEYRNTTLRITLTSFDRTMNSDDASIVVNQIAKALQDTIRAKIV